MASSQAFIDFVLEQLDPVGNLKAGRLFGGHGLKVGDVNFAFINDDTLYLRADETLAATLKSAGGVPFSITRDGKVLEMKYISVSGDLLDDRETMAELGKASLAAAREAKPTKKKASGSRAKPKAKPGTS